MSKIDKRLYDLDKRFNPEDKRFVLINHINDSITLDGEQITEEELETKYSHLLRIHLREDKNVVPLG